MIVNRPARTRNSWGAPSTAPARALHRYVQGAVYSLRHCRV